VVKGVPGESSTALMIYIYGELEMKKFLTMMTFGLLAVVLIMTPELAIAADSDNAGEELLDSVFGLITGSLGTLIGLGIALFGLYMWLIQQSSWGIMVMIGGVAVTAFPGIFEWMRAGFADATDGQGTESGVDLQEDE
jgi:hypothetical protein